MVTPRRLFVLWSCWALGAAAMPTACKDSEPDCSTHCGCVCQALDTCNLLPSPLGVDGRSCQERCEDSGEEARDLITTLGGQAVAKGSWCAEDRCVALANDLAVVLGDVAFLGEGDIRITLEGLASSSRPQKSVAASCNAIVRTTTHGLECREKGVADPYAFCDELGATEVTFFAVSSVETPTTRPVYAEETMSCVAAATQGVVLERFPPGWALVGAKVRGANRPPSAERPVPYCRVFYADYLALLEAAECRQAPPLQIVRISDDPVEIGGVPCEEAELCDDGLDNDENGLSDCRDPACEMPCVEADCGNGEDDDEDGDIDCDDDDCANTAVCGT
ncbi:MAG: hypothetical protein KC731_09655 [Myxococcales bacterium]|nr:hypothetical protein [Myxococcales bacterium]